MVSALAVLLGVTTTAQNYGGDIARAARDAKAHGESAIEVLGPIIDYVQVSSLRDALSLSKPVFATVIGAVPCLMPDGSWIETIYLLKVEPDTPNASSLPALNRAIVPTALLRKATNAEYAIASLNGGTVVVNGVTVTQKPTDHGLLLGHTYLLFLAFYHPSRPASILCGRSSILSVDESTGRLSPVYPSWFPSGLSNLINQTRSGAASMLRAAIREKK